MKHITKLLAISLVLIVLSIATAVALSKLIFTTSTTYTCVVAKTTQGVLAEGDSKILLRVESVKYPWGQTYDVLRLEDDLYASYDPNQTLTVLGRSIFASENKNNRLKTVSFDRDTGQLIFQENFQASSGLSYKNILQGHCSL